MARCSDCNRFVSFGEPEVELNYDPEVNCDESGIEGCVTVNLPCAECGGAFLTMDMDYEMEIEHECVELKEPVDLDEPQYTIIESDATPYEGMDGKRKTYGAEITCKVRCRDCEEEFEVTTTVAEGSSSFDEY